MEKITDITISLHCGCDKKVVENQMNDLKPLEEKYNIIWNNRIDRYPHAYSSYSKMINEAIITSPTEVMVMINDRTFPTVGETEKIINHLENGIACSLMYNVGFMGFTKQLIKKIGWWDERFLNGGWEDRDWIIRLKEADLAVYESQESNYDYTWMSPLQVDDRCAKSLPHWNAKWKFSGNNVIRMLKEEEYEYKLTEDLSDKYIWKTWAESTLNINYNRPGSGVSGSSLINNKNIV